MHSLPLYSEGCVSFAQGIFTALTVADNVTDREISGHFDRARQVDKPKRPTAPDWRLGGVMTGFSTRFEL
jgi:hypothetical protein